ncbi:fatty acyl-AMP ligase [Streptomyces sp. NPDC060000]|uniref:fatty acyl-AMP ligase n=1 Tax=Streptomyces sp. NPDC060000 TaxID=3347031 RepID=UPI0036CF0A6B
MDSSSPPLAPAYRTLPEYLRHWAESAPDRRAFTFVDHPDPHSRGVHRTLTWRSLDLRVGALAARLAEMAEPGSRVALLCPQGTEYVTGFLAALTAGLVAVPLYPPGLPGHGDRLAGVLADARPAVVLTTGRALAEVAEFCEKHANVPVIAVDRVPHATIRDRHATVLDPPVSAPWLRDAAVPDRPSSTRDRDTAGPDRPSSTRDRNAAGPDRPSSAPRDPDAAALDRPASTASDRHPAAPDVGATAYLQYTSGSTRAPAGVEITHANVVANARQALTAYGADAHPVTCVGWLPLYHDMGLVLSVAAPVVQGRLSVLMDPAAFLREPARWLRLLAAHPRAVSAAPNFAYDYCVSTVTDAQKSELRLGGVAALINGSEPVRPGTADRFHAAFAAQGLAADVHCPSYGLAEATVFVSAARPGESLRRFALDRDALAAGKALPARPDDADAVRLTGCGTPAGQRVRIVDPHRHDALPEGEVGEIWVRGPNVGRGYWNRETESRRVFGAPLTGEPGDWLRTGDLGTVLDGQLIVTGRLKDLIVVDGRNHYPQDVEATVQDAHPAVRRDRLAAFGVPGGEGERVVVVAEHTRTASVADLDVPALARTVRAAVSARHGLRLADVLLVAPGTVPRTSSGKVARALTRARYLAGAYGAGTAR